MHANVRLPLAALLASLALGAQAASFDCKAAKSPTEKAICGSPKLSALDERLAREYERALHALSPAGAAKLKDSQRSWLRFVGTVCGSRKASDGSEPASCTQPEFELRLEQLAQAGVRPGPYTFNHVDFHSAARTQDDAGVHPGFVTAHVGFAQIDAPLDAAATAWNAAQRKDDPGAISASNDPNDVDEDDDTDTRLGCASDRFISLQVDNTQFQHGAAHGSYDHEVRNVWLAPKPRKMTADDLFATGAPWKTKLPPLFWNVYLHELSAVHGEKGPASIEEAIKDSAANPERWLLTPQGLQISFDADEAGCYACNPGPITVPWSALKPMLASPEFAACQAPPAAKR